MEADGDMVKIALNLPDGVYDALEKSRAKSGASRSGYIRDAVEERLRREKKQVDIERYIQGYRRFPETAEEIAYSESLVRKVFAENPWDENSTE